MNIKNKGFKQLRQNQSTVTGVFLQTFIPVLLRATLKVISQTSLIWLYIPATTL